MNNRDDEVILYNAEFNLKEGMSADKLTPKEIDLLIAKYGIDWKNKLINNPKNIYWLYVVDADKIARLTVDKSMSVMELRANVCKMYMSNQYVLMDELCRVIDIVYPEQDQKLLIEKVTKFVNMQYVPGNIEAFGYVEDLK